MQNFHNNKILLIKIYSYIELPYYKTIVNITKSTNVHI